MTKNYSIHVSIGNSKIGKMFNFSMPPGKTCSATACKTCFVNGCYACKSYRQYRNVRAAWDENYNYFVNDPAGAEKEIVEYLKKHGHKASYFRIHVSGDFYSREYFDAWVRIAKQFPAIKFLAFTKQFDMIDAAAIPANMAVRLSDWPGVDIPADLAAVLPVAYCDDHTRPASTFDGAFRCPGSCTTCKHCFDSKSNTVFTKH